MGSARPLRIWLEKEPRRRREGRRRHTWTMPIAREGKQRVNAHSRNTGKRRAAVAVMALALLLAACGGDARPSGAQPSIRQSAEEGKPSASVEPGPGSDSTSATVTPPSEEPGLAGPTLGPGATLVIPPDSGLTYNEQAGGGGGKNIVQLHNRTDGRLRARGSVQLNRITGPAVEPVNLAKAQASCTDCQTIAVALQINLISRDARRVTPENAAVALNVGCTRCFTVARASQYVYTVDDPRQTPPEVTALIRRMDRELRSISSSHSITLEQAGARINAVINEFRQLGDRLDDERDEDRDSSPPDTTGTAPADATSEADASGTVVPEETPELRPTDTAPTAPVGVVTPAEPEIETTPVPTEPQTGQDPAVRPADDSGESRAPVATPEPSPTSVQSE